ncbi:MAG: fluoride efflux transporter CrcB [Bythopirellula sp.]|nr:fluoride efflux transporter CrcB [Bythopirellula sp.]
MSKVLAIAVGGALGAVCRHLVNQGCSQWLAVHAAWGTFAVNIVGCFLLGLLIPLGTGADARWSEVTQSALTVGFLGALTTFSTFGWETHQLFQETQHGMALLNMAASMLIGLVAVSVGLALGKWLIS